jgi:hypothetical protein
MAMVNVSAALLPMSIHPPPPLLPFSPTSSKLHTGPWAPVRRTLLISPASAMKKETGIAIAMTNKEEEEEMEEPSETRLYSFTPLPLLLVAALPGGT